MAKFHLTNFGCRASQADGAALKRQLLDAGLAEVASAGEGEIAVLNTCTVTAAADAEVRQIIRRIHRANPRCRIVVTGCYAQRAPEEIAQLPGVAWVVGNSHKHLVSDILRKQESGVRSQKSQQQESEVRSRESGEEQKQDLVQIEFLHEGSGAGPRTAGHSRATDPESRTPKPESRATVLVGEITEEFHFTPVFPDDHTRPTLKVQDGCDARCAFCIIPAVRGPSRSLAPDTIITEVRRLEEQGYQEIVLSGINLGSYGKDLGRRIRFLGLLERVLAGTSIARLRISSIEPMDVSPDLIRLVAGEPRLAQHFHVPLQSGCDRILRLMNRRYWASQYAERILAIRERIPNCGIGADVMVGFPGEAEQDHAASARFIESLPFTYLHIFPYSARPGTRAAASPHPVNGRAARERAQELRALIHAKRQAFLEAQVGRTLSVVTLDERCDGARVALSSNYLKVLLRRSAPEANTLLDVRILGAERESLIGHPEV